MPSARRHEYKASSIGRVHCRACSNARLAPIAVAAPSALGIGPALPSASSFSTLRRPTIHTLRPPGSQLHREDHGSASPQVATRHGTLHDEDVFAKNRMRLFALDEAPTFLPVPRLASPGVHYSVRWLVFGQTDVMRLKALLSLLYVKQNHATLGDSGELERRPQEEHIFAIHLHRFGAADMAPAPVWIERLDYACERRVSHVSEKHKPLRGENLEKQCQRLARISQRRKSAGPIVVSTKR